ncbi:MAG: O-antigen ligase family protein [Chloroflexota bacterium]
MRLKATFHRAATHTALLTLALTPMWWRHALAPPSFSATYPLGFVIFVPAAATILLWGASGCDGLGQLFRHAWPRRWTVMVCLLAMWVMLSPLWAFMRASRPAVSVGAALQLFTALMFALVITALQPPRRQIMWVLVSIIALHALVGGVQVILQQDIGLGIIGEFNLEPEVGGTSVVQSGETRWLRPYGLLPHPNIYAGFLVVGLSLSAGLLFAENGWRFWLALAIFTLMLWMLFMTFSRAAWLGFIASGVLFSLLTGRYIVAATATRRRIIGLISVAVLLGITFLGLFRPFIFARAGVGTEYTEVRSINDRIVYNEIAIEAIREFPVWGVGAGNFPWYASHYLFYVAHSEYKGDNVHNIYLTVQSELGAIGSLLAIIGVVTLPALTWQPRTTEPQWEHAAFLCSIAALLVIGIFDHYPWTIFHFQLLLWTLAGSTVTRQLPQRVAASSAD